MTLGAYIAAYRAQHEVSQRKFAELCGVSNGYISMLEKGVNPNTQRPITISMPVLKKIADAMGLTFSELAAAVDDIPVDLGQPTTAKEEKLTEISKLLENASDEQREQILRFIKFTLSGQG